MERMASAALPKHRPLHFGVTCRLLMPPILLPQPLQVQRQQRAKAPARGILIPPFDTFPKACCQACSLCGKPAVASPQWIVNFSASPLVASTTSLTWLVLPPPLWLVPAFFLTSRAMLTSFTMLGILPQVRWQSFWLRRPLLARI